MCALASRPYQSVILMESVGCPRALRGRGTDGHAAIWMGPGEQTGELGSGAGGGEGAARGKPVCAHVQCWPGEWGGRRWGLSRGGGSGPAHQAPVEAAARGGSLLPAGSTLLLKGGCQPERGGPVGTEGCHLGPSGSEPMAPRAAVPVSPQPLAELWRGKGQSFVKPFSVPGRCQALHTCDHTSSSRPLRDGSPLLQGCRGRGDARARRVPSATPRFCGVPPSPHGGRSGD